MASNLSENQLAQLSEFITTRMGLAFPQERWNDLERRTRAVAREYGYSDVADFIHWIMAAPLDQEQVEVLASHLTIGETYFWREPQVFEALVTRIIPEIISTRVNGDKVLRIWSAGCATGEEPYSIAIALRRALPDPANWRITILATDINPRILLRARAGVYGKWSFRNAPDWLIAGYFDRKGDKYEIRPQIRTMVTFTYLNLAEDIYPSSLNNTNAMDIIFCRNVLMYFSPERARAAGKHFHSALINGGWLMVGASELSQDMFPQFMPVHFPGAIVYRKTHPAGQPMVDFQAEGLLNKVALNLQVQPPAVWLPVRNEEEAPLPRQNARELQAEVPIVVPVHGALTQAQNLYTQGLYADVVEKLDGTEDPGSNVLLVRALANLGQLSRAISVSEKALAADKLNPVLYYLCATIMLELNREDEALTALKRALYLDSDFVLAHFAIGNLAQRRGNPSVARKSFNNVLAILNAYQPDDVLPEAEGLTAGRLKSIIHATLQTGAL